MGRASLVRDPQFQARYMIERGLEPVANTPEEFRAFLIADRAGGADREGGGRGGAVSLNFC
jgi:hypothetical protein